MATRTLNVVISGDAKGVTKATRQVEGSIERMSRSGSRSLAALRTGMIAVGAAAATGVVVGIKKSAEAAIEAEKANARLEAQLRALNISYSEHEKRIQRTLDAHSQLSGFDDEDLGDSFTNIVRVVGDVNRALELNGLAMDFARAKHMDVAKAGELVGKVAGGNTGILSRYGIQIEKGATATEALGLLQQKFAGQAKAYGETTAGAQDRARVALENLGETIGAKVTPIIADVAEAFSEFIRQMTLGQGPGGRVRRMLERIGETLGDVVEKVKDTVGWFRRHRTTTDVLASAVAGLTAALVAYKVATVAAAVATRTLWGAVVLLNIAMRANPVALVVTGIIALGAALVVAYKRSETFRKIVDTAFDVVKKSANRAATVFTDVVLPAFNAVKTGAEKVWGILKRIGSVLGTVGGAAKDAAGFLNPWGDGLGKQAQDLSSIPNFGGGLMGARPEMAPIAGLGSRFGLRVSSGLRPGAVTSSGRPSWHGTGEALDLSGPPSAMMGFARFMSKRASGLAELIYTPLGGWSNGSRYTPTGKLAADHYDHVHVAMDVGRPGQGDGIGQAVNAARSVGLRGDRLATMVAIAGAESGFNPRINAAGPEDSRGLWQINVGPGANPDMLRLGNLYNPMVNAKAMKIILDRQGLSAWSVYTSGAYRGFLGRARAAIRGGGGGRRGAGGGGGGGGGSTQRESITGALPGSGSGPGASLGYAGEVTRAQTQQSRARAKDNLKSLLDALERERALKRSRLRLIRKVLRGRISKKRRIRLLEEEEHLINEIGDLSDTIKEYRADRAGGATTVSGAEALEAGVAPETDTGGGTDTGTATTAGGDGTAAAIAELTAAIDRQTRFNEWMIRTQSPSIVGAVLAAVNGGLGGKVGLGFQGIRSTPGSVAGL